MRIHHFREGKIAPKREGAKGGRSMNELHEIQAEIENILDIPTWEWEPELDEVLEKLARRKLEILNGKAVTE